jgi:TetR/AcrR family transcriptional regulator, transcriptional repressor of aconitase
MPRISEDQRQARREQILAAAWRCFASRGIHATSMEEIIREAELSAGAVYLYFKGKDELILVAISTYMARLRDMLWPILSREEAPPPLEFIDEVTSIMARHTRRGDIKLNTVILMCWSEAQTNPQVKSVIVTFQVSYRAALTQMVGKWQKSGEMDSSSDPKDVAKALLSFFYGFIVQSALLGEVDPKTMARGMEGLIAGGGSGVGWAGSASV